MTNITISKARYDEILKQAGIPTMTAKEGTKVVAEKIAAIKVILKEIKDVVELSGIQIKIGGEYGEFSNEIEQIDMLHPDWNSSSYDC